MTRRNALKMTRFYDRMTPKERVAMLFRADVSGEATESDVMTSTSFEQLEAQNHLLGTLNSLYSVITPAAIEIRHRVNILQLLYGIAWTNICWARDRDSLKLDRGGSPDPQVPNLPVGLLPELTPKGRLTPEDELNPLDRTTRANIDAVRTQLPLAARERNALEMIYNQLRSEMGVEDTDDPVIRELLDETAQLQEALKESSNWLLNFAEDDFDSPEQHYLELLQDAVDAERQPPSAISPT